MGKKSSPPPPDYQGAAREQSDMSQQIALGQTYADRPDLVTPFGNQTWGTQEVIDPATGKKVTKWIQNVELDPEMKASLDAQQRLNMGRTNAAEGLLGQATEGFSKPMNWDMLPARSGNIVAGDLGELNANPDVVNKAFSFGTRGIDNVNDVRDRATAAVRELQAPGLKQRREAEGNALVNQGFARGSEAWNNAMREVGDAESRADLMAIQAGKDEAAQMFDQNLRAQGQEFQQGAMGDQFENSAQQQQFENTMRLAQQGDARAQQELAMMMQAGNFNNANRATAISEEQMRRGQSLNELNALLTGQQVSMPGNMGNAAPRASGGQAADLLGAAQAQGGYDQGAFANKQAGNQATMQTVGTIAALAAMFM